MKKLFSILILFAILLSLSITSIASQDVTDGTAGNYNAEVSGTYVEGSADTVYNVDITWSGLSFTYTANKVWDETNHTYTTQGGTWGDNQGSITITNHSNTAITATPVWTADSGFTDVTMSYKVGTESITSITIDSAATSGAAVSKIISVIPGGTLSSNATGGRIGQITVTITGESTSGTVTTPGDLSGSDDTENTETDVAETVVVSTADALTSALSAGGNVQLGNDITVSSISINNDVTLDLNGYSLTVSNLSIILNSENVIFYNGTINGYILCQSGTTVLKQPIIFNNTGNTDSKKGIAVEGTGAVICDFDPEDYILLGQVTNNGNGTWTITSNNS